MMTRRMMSPAAARVLPIAIALAACSAPPPTPRERLLAKIRGDALTVIVADGAALAHPRIRGVLDVAAARWPASMSCVLAAAYTAEQVALSVDPGGDVTALIATAADPRCAALSKREPGLWIATIGAAAAAATTSVLDDPRFARARPYLARAPIAGVALGAVHLLGTAQPEPLEAWLAIDAAGGAEAIEHAIAEQVAGMQRDPSTAAVAAKLNTARTGGQVVVRLGASDGDLAAAARAALLWLEDRARPAAAVFACPAPDPAIACSDGTRFVVGSLRTDLAPITIAGRPAPIVANGLVTGLRLDAAVAQLGLDAGDVVIAIDGRLVTSRAMLAARIGGARGTTSVTVRRGTTEKVLQFTER